MEIQRSDKLASELDHDAPPASPPPSAQTESDQRAAATARYQAFAEGSPAPQSEPAWNDAPRCGGFIEHTVLFGQGSGAANDVAGDQVKQGHINDCGLMATLSLFASTAEGRALIHSAVVENKDDRGRTTSYTVTLYRPAWTLFGEAQSYSPVRIDVDPTMCANYAQPHAENGTNEVWTQAIEKAFCIYVGGADQTNVPANQAMEILTGRPAARESFGGFLFGSYDGQRLVSDLNAGKYVVLTSKEPPLRPLIGKHAYAVFGLQTRDGVRCAVLHNPWNTREYEPTPIPLDQLGKYFDCANVVSLR